MFLGGLKLLFEPLHVALEHNVIFGITRLFVVTSAACEIGTERVLVARDGAVRNAITVLVEVAGPVTF